MRSSNLSPNFMFLMHGFYPIVFVDFVFNAVRDFNYSEFCKPAIRFIAKFFYCLDEKWIVPFCVSPTTPISLPPITTVAQLLGGHFLSKVEDYFQAIFFFAMVLDVFLRVAVVFFVSKINIRK